MAPRFGEPGENAETVAAETRAAAASGAELVVFPEAALTGYVFRSRDEARAAAVRADGPELAALASASAESSVHVVCGAIERDGERLYNTAFVLGPDGLVGRYRKVHTLCLGADRFTFPGGEPPRPFDLPFGKLGVHICYDGSFPETARALRLQGARLLVLPTNWPRLDMKREVTRVRAYENRAFYVAVNRVGVERGVAFPGGSLVADPDGRVLHESGGEAGRFCVDLDLGTVERSREVVVPDEYELDLIEDRWPELYGSITAPAPDPRRTGSGLSGGAA